MIPALFLIFCVLGLLFTEKNNPNATTLRWMLAVVAITGSLLMSYESHEAMMMTKSMYTIGTHTELVPQSHIGLRMDVDNWEIK